MMKQEGEPAQLDAFLRESAVEVKGSESSQLSSDYHPWQHQ